MDTLIAVNDDSLAHEEALVPDIISAGITRKIMADLNNQSQAERIERKPGDLDNFFKWAQGTSYASKSVQETLRLIENGHRAGFEETFKGTNYEGMEKTIDARIDDHKKKIKAIKSLKRAINKGMSVFRQTFPEITGCELTLDGKLRQADTLSDLRDLHEEALEEAQDDLSYLVPTGFPASRWTTILKTSFGIVFSLYNDPNHPKDLPNTEHAREITKLVHYHETGKCPEGRAIDVAFGRLKKEFGLSKKQKCRVK